MTSKDEQAAITLNAEGETALVEGKESTIFSTDKIDDRSSQEASMTAEAEQEAPTAEDVTNPDSDDTGNSISETAADAERSEHDTVSSSIGVTSMNTTVFPCIEQPLRVTLHCNGYYLWGLRNGRVIARKRRSEKDEFRLDYTKEEGIVIIHNHKFGSTLSVLTDEKDETHKLVCVKEKEDESEEKSNREDIEDDTSEANRNGEAKPASTEAATTNSATEEALEEQYESEEASKPVITASNANITEEDRKWCFIKGAHGRNGVMLKSLKTGENVAINSNGQLVFATDDLVDDPSINMTWDIECVTGELCFISNPTLDSRLRCDMAGLLSLTNAWKGWEVFRFMEAGHGYVKISSWMHSQWLLCSTEDGKVTTCSHAESFLEDNPKGCCKWAIEKSPDDSGSHSGVIIRSKTFGRLLSVDSGTLKTYGDEDSDEVASKNAVSQQSSQQNDNTNGSASEGVGRWWKSSITGINGSMRNSITSMNNSMRNMSKTMSRASSDGERSVQQKDTTVWQLESAHSQTYYFTSIIKGEKPKTIGPFPQVTPNLRKTDKIQLIRLAQATKLYNTEKKQFIACSADGDISFVDDAQDESTEWVMDKPPFQEGGSVFRSKAFNRYLSYEDLTKAENEADAPQGHLKSLFSKEEKSPKLLGSETIGEREVWRLEPCMPRAVSSEKITTFAIGTGIAVGTTIAMPFALAGAGAVLGAMGAEAGFLFNAIAVTLSGAEALASVGAIGATAYIVFRPEENSLTDDHDKREEEAERAWSKRPLSNWRNW